MRKLTSCLAAAILAGTMVLVTGSSCSSTSSGTSSSTTQIVYTGTGTPLPYPLVCEFESYGVTTPTFGTMVLSEAGGTGYRGGSANGDGTQCDCGPLNGLGNLLFTYTLLPGDDAWFYQAFQGTYTMASDSVSGEENWWQDTIVADTSYQTLLTSATEYSSLSLWAHFFDIMKSKTNGVTVYFSIYYADENGYPTQGPRQEEWLSTDAAWYPSSATYPAGEYEKFNIPLDSPVDKTKLLGWKIEASEPRNSGTQVKLDYVKFE